MHFTECQLCPCILNPLLVPKPVARVLLTTKIQNILQLQDLQMVQGPSKIFNRGNRFGLKNATNPSQAIVGD